MSHSIIPPSSAHIWGAPGGCTGWVSMSQQYPEREISQESAEGTASHEIAAELINDATRGFSGITAEKFTGKAASNGIIFTDEMFDAAKEYADDVIAIMREHSVFGGPNIGIEQHIEAKRVHDLSFGTTDSFIYSKLAGKLFIWDYKFGYEIVEAFENWQSINYAAGILDRLGINGLVDQHLVVEIRIAQPRAFHRDGPIRTWSTTAANLRGYFNILHGNAHEALSIDAKIQSGKHCKYCTARHACPSALTAGMGLYEVTQRPVPIDLTPEAMGVQLAVIKRARKQLEYLESGFEEQVKSLIRSGVNVPGWMVEQGLGRERWIKSVKEVITLGNILGYDLRKPEEVITPNQARKKGIENTVMAVYSEKPNAGLKIVPDNGNLAKQVFTK